jgi:hypothetical protein
MCAGPTGRWVTIASAIGRGLRRASGELQGDGRGKVTVLFQPGPLNRDGRDRWHVEGGQVAGLLRGDDGLVNQRSKLVLDHDRLTAHIVASGCNS